MHGRAVHDAWEGGAIGRLERLRRDELIQAAHRRDVGLDAYSNPYKSSACVSVRICCNDFESVIAGGGWLPNLREGG